MTTACLAIDPGTKNVGVCLMIGPDVLEACTVETATVQRWPLDDIGAIVEMSERAVRTGVEMLSDHAAAVAGLPIVYAVEAVVGPSRHTKAQAHVAQSRQVTESVIGLGISYGTVTTALHAAGVSEVITVRPDGFDHKSGHPGCLDGRLPQDWLKAWPHRHRKGSAREHQRAAYWIGQAALRQTRAAAPAPVLVGAQSRTVAPRRASLPTRPPVITAPELSAPQPQQTPAPSRTGYGDALVAAVLAAKPGTAHALALATLAALRTVEVPEGSRPPEPVDLAVRAVDAGAAPLLRLQHGDPHARREVLAAALNAANAA